MIRFSVSTTPEYILVINVNQPWFTRGKTHHVTEFPVLLCQVKPHYTLPANFANSYFPPPTSLSCVMGMNVLCQSLSLTALLRLSYSTHLSRARLSSVPSWHELMEIERSKTHSFSIVSTVLWHRVNAYVSHLRKWCR